MSSPVLVTLADYKIFKAITSTGDDARLSVLLAMAEKAVENFCARKFAETTQTEYFDGLGRELLILNKRPVTAVSGVWVDGTGFGGYGVDAFPASSAWTVGESWIPESYTATADNPGILRALVLGGWPCGQKNIKVTYTAGFATIPDDLQQAIFLVTAGALALTDAGGQVRSETLGDYSYTLSDGFPEIYDIRSLLTPYRTVAI